QKEPSERRRLASGMSVRKRMSQVPAATKNNRWSGAETRSSVPLGGMRTCSRRYPRQNRPDSRKSRFRAQKGCGSPSTTASILRALADQVLHILLLLSGNAGEREIDVDEILRQLQERAEIRKLSRNPGTEEEHQLAALLKRDPAPAPLGHRAHRRRARAGADHQQARAGMVRHQKRRAVGADHAHRVS